jgi:hypothetical protein
LRILTQNDKSKEDLKDPVIRKKVLTQTLELLYLIKEKQTRKYENYLKIESFRQNIIKLYKKFGDEFEKNSDLVINQYIIVFRKFAGLQQNINNLVEQLKAHK